MTDKKATGVGHQCKILDFKKRRAEPRSQHLIYFWQGPLRDLQH